MSRPDSASACTLRKFPLSNNRFISLVTKSGSRTLVSNSKGQTLDHDRHEALSFDRLAYVNKVEFGQTDLVNTRQIPSAREPSAHHSRDVLVEHQQLRNVLGAQFRESLVDAFGQLLRGTITQKRRRCKNQRKG